jgi:dolichyl-phosphate-mannose-protein mannosyltransferase
VTRPATWVLILCAAVGLAGWAVYFRHAWELLAEGRQAWVLPDIGQSLRFSGLPYAAEAASRAGRAIVAAMIALMAIGGAGRLAIPRLLPTDATPLERILFGFSLGAGSVGYVFLALATIGAYRPVVVRSVLIAAALATLVWTAFSRRHTNVHTRDVGFRDRLDVLWALFCVATVLLALFCALAPETEYDALWYHLELPRRWLRAGRPVDDLTEYVSLYPMTWELLYGGLLSLDGTVAARLLHWAALPACGGCAALIARRASPTTSPWLVAAVFMTPPTIFWEATTAYVDLANALFAGLGAYALMRAFDGDQRRWWVVAGLEFGLACATKHLGLVALACALAVLCTSRLRRASVPDNIRSAVLVAALALAVALPWYVRSYAASGNPFFPELYKVFGARPPERWNERNERGLGAFKAHFGRPRTPFNLATLPWDVGVHPARYAGTLGPLLIALLPLALVAGTRNGASRAVLAGALLYAAVWASPLSSYQMRFLVPFWIVMAPLMASGGDLLLQRGPWARAATAAFVAASLFVSLPPFTALHDSDRQGWTGWLTHILYVPPSSVVLGGMTGKEYISGLVRSFDAWQWIDAHTPPAARVLTFFGGDHFYTHRARIWTESGTAHPITWGAVDHSGADIAAGLGRLSVAYVIAPSAELMTPEYQRLDLLRPETVERLFERVYADRWTVVYRVRDAGSGASPIDQRYGR